MKAYMEDHLEELEEAKEQGKLGEEFEDWWDDMKEHMEERWTELEDDGYYRYGGFGRYGGCHW